MHRCTRCSRYTRCTDALDAVDALDVLNVVAWAPVMSEGHTAASCGSIDALSQTRCIKEGWFLRVALWPPHLCIPMCALYPITHLPICAYTCVLPTPSHTSTSVHILYFLPHHNLHICAYTCVLLAPITHKQKKKEKHIVDKIGMWKYK